MKLTGPEYIEVQDIADMFNLPLNKALELYLIEIELIENPIL